MILFAVGLLISIAWLWAGWYYVSVYIGQDNIFHFLPAELGQFLLGFLAPLGILWLLISQSATRRRLARVERQIGELASRPDTPAAAAPSEPHFDTPSAKFGQAGAAQTDAAAPEQEGAPKATPPERASQDWKEQDLPDETSKDQAPVGPAPEGVPRAAAAPRLSPGGSKA